MSNGDCWRAFSLLTDLLRKREEAERLLRDRQRCVQRGDFELAQTLKNRYDQLTSTAVNVQKVGARAREPFFRSSNVWRLAAAVSC